MSTYREMLLYGKEYLKQHDIADADVDSWYLLAHVCGMNRAEYLLRSEEIVAEKEYDLYIRLLKKRGSHIPLQLITGTQEFMGLGFHVSSDVLIPRQDTENLVIEVLKVCEGKSVLDMCTGSACIIVSLAKLGSLKKAVGVDISEKALSIASKNAEQHKVKVEFIESDLFANIEGMYDIIVSNPPYIPTKDIESLMVEVKDHEPIIALDGDEDGLSFYKRIGNEINEYLTPKGYIFLEIGYDQGLAVTEILVNAGIEDIKVIKDLSGLDRVVYGRRP
ncbi:MAG TPA: peptide chain release factor N(5)-glutamine methyltransferase [Clostridiales bacterium]|nr:peptide chain release factor N(5)-glutamine methyltransferase [Clostridiales bacterium]